LRILAGSAFNAAGTETENARSRSFAGVPAITHIGDVEDQRL